MMPNIDKRDQMADQAKNWFLREYQDWKHVFGVCFLLNVLAYGTYITNATYTPDDYLHILAKVDQAASGRWFAGFIYNCLLQANYMPVLTPFICITSYIFTGIGLCKLWEIQKKSLSVAVIALWSLHPYLLDAYNFRMAAALFALVYLMAVAALLWARKGKMGILLSILLYYLALSTYQAVLGFTISVIMIQILITGFRDDFTRKAFDASKKALWTWGIMLFVSIILYFILTKATFVLFDLQATARVKAGFITSLEQLKTKIGWLALTLAIRVLPVPEYVLPLLGKLTLFGITVAGVFAAIRKTTQWTSAVLVFLWILAILVGAVSFMIPLAASDLPWRVCMGLVVLTAGLFVITQESNSWFIRRAALLSAVFLIAYFIVTDNAVLYKQHLRNQKDILLANRMLLRIEASEDYRPGMKLVLVGNYSPDYFTKEGKTSWQIVKEYTKNCMKRQYSLASSPFETDWSKYGIFLKYLDAKVQQGSPQMEHTAALLAAGRKPWPDPSSVFIHENMAIVVLSLPENNGMH
jgi:hypothetical protein